METWLDELLTRLRGEYAAQGIDWNDFPHLKGWFDEIGARPAVMRGVEVLADQRKPISGDKEREVLFGKTQYQPR